MMINMLLSMYHVFLFSPVTEIKSLKKSFPHWENYKKIYISVKTELKIVNEFSMNSRQKFLFNTYPNKKKIK